MKRSLKARILLPLLVLTVAFAVAMAGLAAALVTPTSLTLHAPKQVTAGQSFTVHGKVVSSLQRCRNGRTVTLYIDGNADGSATAAPNGDYTITAPGLTPGHHNLQTKTPSTVLPTPHNNRHTCHNARSAVHKVHAA